MLSFGLELEIIASIPTTHAKTESCALNFVAEAIRHLDRPAAVFLPRSSRSQPDYSIWNVCLDVTIIEEISTTYEHDHGSRDIEYVGTEIVSPVFHETQDWCIDVEAILGPSGVSAAIPLATNRSTGFHVHVGLSDEPQKGFSLDQVKANAIPVMFFEDVVDRLHDRCRSVLILNEDIIMSNRQSKYLKD